MEKEKYNEVQRREKRKIEKKKIFGNHFLFYFLILSLFMLKLTDVIMTYYALELGCIEMNPLWYRINENVFLVVLISFFPFIVIVFLVLLARKDKVINNIAIVSLLAFNVYLIGVLCWNLSQLNLML